MNTQSAMEVLVYVGGPHSKAQVLRALNLITQHFPTHITLLAAETAPTPGLPAWRAYVPR
ncbi:MAG: hypothetical protein HZY76_18090 [Anaerolineae bacterium]|nr:MAG: hypothetical protein HZY76_18090 [Anaerolineae bacterium]